MSKDLAVIYQEKYSSEIKIALSEAKGGKLKTYCNSATGTGMEKYTFYLDRDYSTGTAPQFYNNDAYTGTSGTRSKYSVTPEPIYAHEKIAWKDMQKSMLKADSNFMKGFANALDLAVDIEIIKAIETATGVIQAGNVLETITTDANILAFKQSCFLSIANTDTTNVVEGANNVAIVMDTRDYANLMPKGGTEGNMISSADFKIYNNANGVLTTSLFGCDIITFKKFNAPAKWGGRLGVIEQGTTYFIPNNTLGLVEWEAGNFSDSKYLSGNGDVFTFMTRKSVGTIALEPESIIQFNTLQA